MANNPEYATKKYRTNRSIILQGNPDCTICGGPGANSADHILSLMAGGTSDLDNLRPVHTRCNSRRGATEQAQALKQKQQRREQGMKTSNAQTKNTTTEFFYGEAITPTAKNSLSFVENQPELARTGKAQNGSGVTGSEQPRLELRNLGVLSYGDLVAEWAQTYMQVSLMPWQVYALNGLLACDDPGEFLHRRGLVSTARQQGKSVLLTALVGWYLTTMPSIVGRPVNILSTANMLDRAEGIFANLAPILKETFDAKISQVVGRKSVTLRGSKWEIRAASIRLHGGSYDLVVADEVFDIQAAVIETAILPTMIAKPHPLFAMFSTAGDANSDYMLATREEALTALDKGEESDLYFAEWSMPPDANPHDESMWGYPNPALGTTVTMAALRAAAKKDYFLRAHLNQWITARGAWLDPGVWGKGQTTQDFPDGPSFLAVDSSLDDSTYYGVRAAMSGGQVIVDVAFVVDSEDAMWEQISVYMADHQCTLAVTPSLEIHVPQNMRHRYIMVGYGELLKWSVLAQKMILEGKVLHTGSRMLEEHCQRAVMVKTAQGAVLSSQKSPGPIALCRLMVFAACLISRPMQRQKPTLVVSQ